MQSSSGVVGPSGMNAARDSETEYEGSQLDHLQIHAQTLCEGSSIACQRSDASIMCYLQHSLREG